MVYSIIGFLIGVLALPAGVGAWKSIGAALTIGSLAVGIGSLVGMGTARTSRSAGVMIALGAAVSSAAFCVIAANWSTSNWYAILSTAVVCVVFLGGGPILIGISYWRR